MRELSTQEVELVSGGNFNGYEAAGAILAVAGTGAALAGSIALSPVVAGIVVGTAGGMAIAQLQADFDIF